MEQRSQADTRVYQVVHDVFRLATNRLVDASEKLEPSKLQPVIGQYWSFYSAVLHHHHHNEDDSIFPALLAVRPDMTEFIKTLEDDHRQLIRTMEAVDSAIAAFDKQPDASHQKAVSDAAVGVREMFFPHLDAEDEKVLPAIAQSIPPSNGTVWTRRRSSRSRGSTCRGRWVPSTKSSNACLKRSNRRRHHRRSDSCWPFRGVRNGRPG